MLIMSRGLFAGTAYLAPGGKSANIFDRFDDFVADQSRGAHYFANDISRR
jgi:hypothetical protein